MASKAGAPLIVVYHADCIDGAACAWAMAKSWDVEKDKPANVTYIPYAHHNARTAEDEIRKALKDDAYLYFVDVAPSKKFLDELMTPTAGGLRKVEAVHVLDHHNTAADELRGYKPPAAENRPHLNIHIEETRASAARMVWETMLPRFPVPPVLDVIDKMDGDAKGLATPREFAAAALVDTRDISSPDRAFRSLRGLARLTFNAMARAGRNTLTDQDVKIDKLLANATTVSLQILPGEPPVPVAIVCGDVKQFGRQISERLTELGREAGSGVAFSWFMQKTGAVTVSIRTGGEPSASDVAAYLRETLGVTGGGHDAAAAVHFPSLFDFARQMPFAAHPVPLAAPSKNSFSPPVAKDEIAPGRMH